MNNRYTPERIASGNEHFVIPIYQRLFEWDNESVSILLNDLYHSFKISPEEEYYIGLLTSTADGDLVDGQQRFTVMSLFACIFHEIGKDDNWGRFMGPDCNRLEFRSRSNDAEYLKGIFNDGFDEDQTEGINYKMHYALLTIKNFISDIKSKAGETEASEFIDYIFKKLSFFISPLPQNYSARDLNKYFERMNSTGKNLEQHEILKVKLLRNLDGDISSYMRLWNLLSEMNKLLIRKREGESEEQLRNRKNIILSGEMDSILSSEIINGLILYRREDGSKPKSIREIKASTVTPKEHHETEQNTSSVLSFPQLLLLTLYWKIKDNEKQEAETKILEKEFFNPVNLLETFQNYLPYEGNLTHANVEDIKDFMLRLTRARVIFDSCFVRSSEWGYTFEGISEESLQINVNTSNDGSLKKLQMLEAMMYVSTPSRYYDYRWFMPMVKTVSDRLPSPDELWQKLKDADDKSHSLPPLKDLSYGDRIRYWLWRLDYYIWSNRRVIFKDYPDALRVASNYSFVRNRSLEHVAPQHPEGNSTLQWNQADDAVIRDSFGNMVMISGGMNSSLKNRAYEVKKAHVQAYISNSKNGSIESLSLLALNTFYDNWDRNTIAEYGEKAYKWLEESFMTKETQL